jgi:predicted transcriptional regulator
MNKTLTEMAAEIIAARVRHEAMTSEQIKRCLDDTFEALQKLKAREDASLRNAVQPIITPEKSPQAKPEELEKPAVQAKKSTIVSTILNLIKSKPKLAIDKKFGKPIKQHQKDIEFKLSTYDDMHVMRLTSKPLRKAYIERLKAQSPKPWMYPP